MTGSSVLSADDRLALRSLVESYALGVDQRRSADVASLFAADGVLVVPATPTGLAAPVERVGRSAIAKAMDGIARYDRTLHAIVGHVVGGSVGGQATGVASCLAHHVRGLDGGGLSALVWGMHYFDDYVFVSDEGELAWRFARRRLEVDWIEERPVESVRSFDETGHWVTGSPP